ncbi:MAG TPA: (2Fe-2S) ferredoxin domain-containing protein [Planctomycetota bacterium]|nr:(2Fe-2S) ferredoxin domain-containing protein [Planctomycetota bacterium]
MNSSASDAQPAFPYARHVFVCVNRRPPGAPRGCCAERGAEEVRDRLKAAAKEARLPTKVRINAAGCLDFCEQGVTVAVYPENVWYGGVTIADVPEIVASHLRDGRPIERLRIPPRILERRDG